MEMTEDSLRNHIPYYLTEPQKEGLLKALNDFKSDYKKQSFYDAAYKDILLQGDGWRGFQVINFKNGEKAKILGVILSNTCDVATENKRDLPAKVTFSPILSLSSYVEFLKKAGIDADRIDNKLCDIRAQRVTNIIYLPTSPELQGEHIVLLSDVHTMPLTAFQDDSARRKIFTLSMFGFYLFIFKLSIHFCRFHENVDRV